jgi:hypothetical protein
MMVVVRPELEVSGRMLEVMRRTMVVRGGEMEVGDRELVVVK